jgi:hypothetical protein
LACEQALDVNPAVTAKSEANTQIDFMNAYLRREGASLLLAATEVGCWRRDCPRPLSVVDANAVEQLFTAFQILPYSSPPITF